MEELFESFEKARTGDRKKMLVQQICTELMVHATIEEEIFYPAARGIEDEDLLDEAYVEHDGAKVLIAELLQGSPSDEFYDAKVKVLSEMIKHHVKERGDAVRGTVRRGARCRRRSRRLGRASEDPQGAVARQVQGSRETAAAADPLLYRTQARSERAGHGTLTGPVANLGLRCSLSRTTSRSTELADAADKKTNQPPQQQEMPGKD